MMTLRAQPATHGLWRVVLAWGALTLALGILMLLRPGRSVLVAAALLAAYLVISGIAEMVFGAVVDASVSSRIPLFVTGALSLALGVLAFRHFGYAYAVLLLALAIGAVFIFEGISDIAFALEDRSLPDRGWYVFLGILEVIAGVVMLAWPFRSLAVATIVAGVWLVAIAQTEIVWALLARRAVGHARRTVGPPAHTAAERDDPHRAPRPSVNRRDDQRSSARDITTR